jgi:hypothetical protein
MTLRRPIRAAASTVVPFATLVSDAPEEGPATARLEWSEESRATPRR